MGNYAFPPKSTSQHETTNPDGSGTISYVDAAGAHHEIVIDKFGKAKETVKVDKNGKQETTTREYDVSYKPDGSRVETENIETDKDDPEATHTITTTFGKDGRRKEKKEFIFNAKKRGKLYERRERESDEEVIEITTYDDDGDRAKVVKEKLEYDDIDFTGNRDLVKGERTTTTFKDKKPKEATREKYDPEARQWVKG
jgi:hypothetical protein